MRLLSDLIRAGAKRRRQAFGAFFGDYGSCALGAAYEEAFDTSGNGVYVSHQAGVAALEKVMPCGYRRSLGVCPELLLEEPLLPPTLNVLEIIPWLNDKLKWSREKIADWVEKQELKMGLRQPEPEPEPVPMLLPLPKPEEPSLLDDIKARKAKEPQCV